MIDIIKGDNHTIKVTYKKKDDPDATFTGDVWLTIKSDITKPDNEAVLQKRKAVTGATEIVFELVPEDTNIPSRTYRADIQLVSDGVVTSTKVFEVQILEDVTKDTVS